MEDYLKAMLKNLGQLFCRHQETVPVLDKARMYLVCCRCGWTSEGWQLAKELEGIPQSLDCPLPEDHMLHHMALMDIHAGEQ